jgi:hypothetical protein
LRASSWLRLVHNVYLEEQYVSDSVHIYITNYTAGSLLKAALAIPVVRTGLFEIAREKAASNSLSNANRRVEAVYESMSIRQ